VTVLGFDTATPATVVALLRPGSEPVAFRHYPRPGERPGHTSRLLPGIERVLREAGTGWDEVERLGVGVGPGTFTGLRIGVATARGLAQARDLPVAGVGTLRTLAQAGAGALAGAGADPAGGRPVLAVLDARRGELFAAAWAGGARVLEPAALRPESLLERAGALARRGIGAPLAVGDGAVASREGLEALGIEVPADASELHRVDARQLCRLASAMEPGRWEDVRPQYLRLPDAEIAHRQRTQT
jgi:tRNA threonylcarbamoyladenosine biosynthesis protein TsaB